jgi:hypothetical protein
MMKILQTMFFIKSCFFAKILYSHCDEAKNGPTFLLALVLVLASALVLGKKATRLSDSLTFNKNETGFVSVEKGMDEIWRCHFQLNVKLNFYCNVTIGLKYLIFPLKLIGKKMN